MTLLAIVMGASVTGCSSPSKSTQKAKPKEQPLLKEELAVRTAPGEATERDLKTRMPAYHVRWQEARIQISNAGPFAGSMTTVTGEMYDKGQIVNVFKADNARADRQTRVLVLTGNVRVDSKITGTTLTCDTLEWHHDQHKMIATGHVKATGAYGSLTMAKEMWAFPDLREIATPDMFKA